VIVGEVWGEVHGEVPEGLARVCTEGKFRGKSLPIGKKIGNFNP
jgi:hypothetical protein